MQPLDDRQFAVAIIGMAGRFPGTKSIAEYWENLKHGREMIRSFSQEELLELGVPPSRLTDPDFVPCGGHVPGPDLFAASFFGYTPGEARLMDPQQRLFLECTWEALEDAGYAPRSLPFPVGVFAGTSLSTYLLFNLNNNSSIQTDEEAFQVMIGNDKDFLCTRLSYKLNLKGPSMTIQSGCSTSLVAVHMAVQSLLNYQCDMALAGGASVGVPQRTGYRYQPGGVNSPDGHCRVFDAGAAGTIFGDGVGTVVLKRLEDAQRDRDNIQAIILGSAVNNDGYGKIGYTAPSVEGQTEVIARALAIAGVTADKISYVEAHGTATALGDPIELSALTKAFRQTTEKQDFCGVGSVKSNIGHLDAAAGVAGLIKTALMLKHRFLVPSLHYRQANPRIEFGGSPFYVVTEPHHWEAASVRRAGVSSFGIGGTNAHVILEEPPQTTTHASRRPLQILSLSAQTEPALQQMAEELAGFLETSPPPPVPDVAYTLHVGRQPFKHRLSIVCNNCSDAVETLRSGNREKLFHDCSRESRLKTAFLFPGGGTQYPGMGEELYKTEPEFRSEVDRCCAILKEQIGYDLKTLVYPIPDNKEDAAGQLAIPATALPAIFFTEYALARLLISWGIQPDYLLGHSLGEYTAACLAGVFSLEDALRLVTFRGKLFDTLPTLAMLSVYCSEQEISSFLNDHLSISSINSPEQCLISGTASAIDELARTLSQTEIEAHRLHIQGASHSFHVEPVIERFRQFLMHLPMRAPSIPFISNRTGTWITPEQAASPDYWVEHLRHSVRFADGVQNLTAGGDVALIEVGPSRSLTTLAIANCRKQANLIHACMRHPQDSVPELAVLYRTLAKLWNAGVEIDWKAFYKEDQRCRLSLPSYPFERQRYWVDPQPASVEETAEEPTGALPAIYKPCWQSIPLEAAVPATVPPKTTWILILDGIGIGSALRDLLSARGEHCCVIQTDDQFAAGENGAYRVRRWAESDFYTVFKNAKLAGSDCLKVIDLENVAESEKRAEEFADFQAMQQKTLFTLLPISKALTKVGEWSAIEFYAISTQTAQVSGADPILPEKTPLIGALRVMPQECSGLSTCLIDIALTGRSTATIRRIAGQIFQEAAVGISAPLVAYRGLQRWKLAYKTLPQSHSLHKESALRPNGVYWITGGLGELGPLVAKSIAERVRCKLVLTGRSAFPPKQEWPRLLASSTNPDRTTRTVQMFQEIENSGSELALFSVDASDPLQMAAVLEKIEHRFGQLNGVIHLAGVTGAQALRLITDLDEMEYERQLSAKAGGCYSLSKVLTNKKIDFCVLFSSTASVLGGAGMSAYAAANCLLDSFAEAHSLSSGQRWISINWDGWLTEFSIAVMGAGKTALDQFALQYDEAILTFHRILDGGLPGQHAVSKGNLQRRIREDLVPQVGKTDGAQATQHPYDRLSLTTEYVPPVTELQHDIASVWGQVLGIEQVGLMDNLFELGGNSLIALRIISRLKRLKNIEIPVTVLFEAPTVLALSNVLSSQPSPETYEGSRRRGEIRRQRHALSTPA